MSEKDSIRSFPELLHRTTADFYREVPSRTAARGFLRQLVGLLFPITHGSRLSLAETEERWADLQRRFAEIIRPVVEADQVDRLTERFFAAVPAIYENMMADAAMYVECDPASFCKDEVILCYPGFFALMVYRFSHVMYTLGIPILPRILSEHAHSKTGIDIHPGATIGRHCYIDHGTGIVIGETTVIGDSVKIYQGVTLGAAFVDKELRGCRRHPTIEDNVIIYAGSTILGGNTVIGHDTVIGGNVWLTESVPPYSRVYHRPEIVIKGKKLPEEGL